MKFPFSFGNKKKSEYFLALLLRDEAACAVIFEEIQGKIRVIGEHVEPFLQDLENAEAQEWLNVIDKAVSSAESSLPSSVQTQKTIFGVKETWVENGKIKKEYLVKLKHVSETLGLSPIGFIVLHEAITHLLQKEEGAPVSAVLVEVGKNQLIVSLLRAGKIIETRRSQIEETVSQTVDRILHHFTSYDVLPSRIILFDGRETDKLTQEFISHSWSKSLPFLHVPQIVKLPQGFDAKAILYGAASQMGFEVLGQDLPKIVKKDAVDTQVKSDEALSDLEHEPLKTDESERSESVADVPDAAITEDNFGFVYDSDITADNKSFDEKSTPSEEELEKEALGEDIKKPSVHHETQGNLNAHFLPMTSLFKNFLGKIKLPKKQSEPSVHHQNDEKPGRGKVTLQISPKVLIPLIGVFAVIGLITGAYVYLQKSTITLVFRPEVIEQKTDIVFSDEKSSDFNGKIIALEQVTNTQEGTKTINSTGTKEIGDKAKGTITIFSRLPSEKTFSEGTTITSSNNLSYTLDKDVKLASSSADASASPSTAKIAVTAKQIGKESNLPSDTKFTVTGFDIGDVVGKNESAFSGGSKKEIIVVAKADIDKLTSEVTKSLEVKAKEDIKKQVNSDMVLLPFFSNISLKEKNFDKKEGDEAKSVTIKALIEYQVSAYKNEEINEFAKFLLKDKLDKMNPSGDGISYEVLDVKQNDDDTVSGNIMVKAQLVPKIDNKKLIAEIKGKSKNSALDILSQIPHVEGVKIDFSPSLPFLPQMLPRRVEGITIQSENK